MKFAVDFVQHFSWPFTALILGLAGLLLFRKPINSFLTRLRSASKDGLVAGPDPGLQLDKRKQQEVQKLMDFGSSPVLLAEENSIGEDLKRRGLEAEGETVAVLVRHLAATRLLLEAEQVYNLIFGSQIALLKALNETGAEGIPLERVETFFAAVKEKFPTVHGSRELKLYLAFLFARNLIYYNAPRYLITDAGVEFLAWMARTGRSENRAF